jgi:hypothetical protein
VLQIALVNGRGKSDERSKQRRKHGRNTLRHKDRYPPFSPMHDFHSARSQ